MFAIFEFCDVTFLLEENPISSLKFVIFVIKKGSLILLKICSYEVHDKWMCAIFEFCDVTFFIGRKSNFKFEILEILVQKYPRGEAFFKGSLMLLKLGTLLVQDKWMCAIFEFCDVTFFIGRKSDFKFEILKNLVQKPPREEAFFSIRSGQFIRDFLNKIYVEFH